MNSKLEELVKKYKGLDTTVKLKVKLVEMGCFFYVLTFRGDYIYIFDAKSKSVLYNHSWWSKERQDEKFEKYLLLKTLYLMDSKHNEYLSSNVIKSFSGYKINASDVFVYEMDKSVVPPIAREKIEIVKNLTLGKSTLEHLSSIEFISQDADFMLDDLSLGYQLGLNVQNVVKPSFIVFTNDLSNQVDDRSSIHEELNIRVVNISDKEEIKAFKVLYSINCFGDDVNRIKQYMSKNGVSLLDLNNYYELLKKYKDEFENLEKILELLR